MIEFEEWFKGDAALITIEFTGSLKPVSMEFEISEDELRLFLS